MRLARCPKENRERIVRRKQAADEIGKFSSKFPLGRRWTLQLRKDNRNNNVSSENILLSMDNLNLLA